MQLIASWLVGSRDAASTYEVMQDVASRIKTRVRGLTTRSQKNREPPAAVALYFMYYNFGRVHQTLRVTPAMEVGVSDHVWSVEEIVALLPS